MGEKGVSKAGEPASDAEFKKRQEEAKELINESDREDHKTNPRRDQFFETVF